MTSSFDSLLDASAPPTTPRTPELEHELAAMISEAEAVAAPARSRLRRRMLIGGLATIGVLGVGAAANAGGLLPWFDSPAAQNTQVTSSGASCKVTYGAKGHEDPKHPVDDTTRAAAVAAAGTFLRDFDFSTIDVDEAIRKLPPRVLADSEGGPAQSIEEYETFALQTELERQLNGYLGQRGLPVGTVSVSAMTSCDGGGK